MEINGKRVLKWIGVVALLLIGVWAYDKMVINVEANEIVVTQDPVDGELHFHTTPGLKNQNFGTVVGTYQKSNQYDFDIPEDRKKELKYEDAFSNPEVAQYGIKVRFNDDGDAYIFGSMRYEVPRDEATLEKIQEEYGSIESVEADLVQRVVNNAVFQTGPLMSSKESSAEKRSDLLWYIEDMTLRGAYKTKKKSRFELDPITGDSVEVKYAQIVEDMKRPDHIARQNRQSQFEKFGITGSNFTISQIVYSPKVEEQIAKQQQLTMQIQIAKAKALEAQQNEITAEADGKQKATTAKWEQEIIKAKETTKAQMAKEVAQLKSEEADFYKTEQIRIGEGNSQRRRLEVSADDQLKLRLDQQVEINKIWAAAFKDYKGPALVPTTIIGGDGKGGGGVNAMEQIMNLMLMDQVRKNK